MYVCVYSSLNMLTAIEGCLEQLFETIESLPADKVEAAEKVRQLLTVFTVLVPPTPIFS